MSKVTNINCDSCGKILYGFDKAARVRQPNINICGNIILQCVDPDTGYNFPIYITKNKEGEDLHFCDLVCMQEYIDMKEKNYYKYREGKLREEANANAINRGSSNPTY